MFKFFQKEKLNINQQKEKEVFQSLINNERPVLERAKDKGRAFIYKVASWLSLEQAAKSANVDIEEILKELAHSELTKER